MQIIHTLAVYLCHCIKVHTERSANQFTFQLVTEI